jgi:hypothetical protein
MRLKKTITALIACLALGAVAANMAQAEGTCWTIQGVCLADGGVTETVSIEKHIGSSLSLTATFLGIAIRLDATGVGCASGTACTIDHTVGKNHSAGKLEFTGVTVIEPANCTVHSVGKTAGKIVTNAMTVTVIMDKTSGSTAVFDKFFTDSGAFFEPIFGGEKCVLNELSIPWQGSLTGRVVHAEDAPGKTGEQFVTQSLLFNKAEQETGGGSFTLGEGASAKVAFLDATIDNRLSGANVGKIWGSD